MYFSSPGESNGPYTASNGFVESYAPGGSLDEHIEDWYSQLSVAIDKIAPEDPLCSCSELASWSTPELWLIKQKLRHLEGQWQRAHDEATKVFYRPFM